VIRLVDRRTDIEAVLLLLFSTVASLAADSTWFARPWESNDGLPNDTITGLAQTSDGYLWISTPVGIARFDGVHFEEYSHTNYIAEPNRGVIALARSGGDTLWLAMDRGPIVRLNAGTAEVFGVTNGLPDHTVQRLVEDGKGGVWVSYRNGNIYHIENGKIASYGRNEGAPRGPSYSLATDVKGRLWLAQAGEIYLFRGDHFEKLFELEGAINCLAPARGSGVWLCAGLHLYKCDEDSAPRDFGAFEASQSGTAATTLFEDHTGAVWIGSSYSGLFRFDGTGYQNISTSHSGITTLLEDREGSLWAGTSAGGLNRIRRRVVQLEGEDTGMPLEAVQSMSEGEGDTLWAATHNGLLIQRTNQEWRVVPIPGGDASCVAADRAGGVWVGTANRQLFHWQEGRVETRGRDEGLEGNNLHSLLLSSKGDLWIGGPPDVIQRIRAGKLDKFKLSSDNGAVRAMAEDSSGTIWIGSAHGLLLRVNGDSLTNEPALSSGAPMSIRCLYAASNGDLWIGFAGYGLGRLRQGHLLRVTSEHGLYDDYVSQIAEDDHGWLWCGGDHGIFRVRREDIEDFGSGRLGRIQSIHYGQGEGLPSLQAALGVSPGAFRARDGRLWIPMRTALAVVDPGQLHEDTIAPPVLLNRVTMDAQPVAWYGNVLPMPGGNKILDLQDPHAIMHLPPQHRRLNFEFTALSFKATDNVHFRYRLEGLEEGWTDVGTKRNEEYSRLSPGPYCFHVAACNSDGVWNDTGASLRFVVDPFFWQTWWFRGVALAAFTISVVAFVRYISVRRLRLRLQALEQQAALDKERARIARDIHDDVGAGLSEITILSELASRERVEAKKAGDYVRQISASARQVTDSLDEIVWAVNPGNDTLPHLVSYLGQFAMQFLQMAGVRCRLDLPDQPPKRILSAEVRHNLFLASKEALNNVVRHAEATEASLQISVTDASLAIMIEDNGKGFEPGSGSQTQDGLRNLRQRLQEIGGECRIDSKPGTGTRIEFSYPWPGPPKDER
jgi:signal transduction histidine kinase/ligand-binding sensor domain-containing protein